MSDLQLGRVWLSTGTASRRSGRRGLLSAFSNAVGWGVPAFHAEGNLSSRPKAARTTLDQKAMRWIRCCSAEEADEVLHGIDARADSGLLEPAITRVAWRRY